MLLFTFRCSLLRFFARRHGLETTSMCNHTRGSFCSKRWCGDPFPSAFLYKPEPRTAGTPATPTPDPMRGAARSLAPQSRAYGVRTGACFPATCRSGDKFPYAIRSHVRVFLSSTLFAKFPRHSSVLPTLTVPSSARHLPW